MNQTTYQLTRNVEHSPISMQASRKESPIILMISRSGENRSLLKSLLSPHGITVREGEKVDPSRIDGTVSAVLLDVPTFRSETIELCKHLQEERPEVPVIVLDSPGGDANYRREIIQHAFFHLVKPCDPHHLLSSTLSAVRARKLLDENQKLRELHFPPSLESVVVPTRSEAGRTLQKQIHAFGKLGCPILISGDRGSDKNVVARMIHQVSSRAERGFYHIVCDAISNELLEEELWGSEKRRGKFELLDGGTIFLDHVEGLSPASQRKLLYFMKTKTYHPFGADEGISADVRVIASTKAAPLVAYSQKQLEEELFLFLSGMPLHLPPLRERIEDLEEFAQCILSRLGRLFPGGAASLSRSALQKLQRHDWPGNFAELESVLFRAMEASQSGVIEASDLVFSICFQRASDDGSHGLAGLTREELEYLSLTETLAACKGNRSKAAKMLGISEKTVYNMLDRFSRRKKNKPE